MLKKAVQQGRSEVHGAKNDERQVCGRRRDGETAMSGKRVVLSGYGEGLNDARTPLADFFSILLIALPRHQMNRSCLDRGHHGNT